MMYHNRTQSALLIILVIKLIQCSSAHDHFLSCREPTQFFKDCEPGITLAISFVLESPLEINESISWNRSPSGESGEIIRCEGYTCPTQSLGYRLNFDFQNQSFFIFITTVEPNDSGNHFLVRFKNDSYQCLLANFTVTIIGASSSVTSSHSTTATDEILNQESSTGRHLFSTNVGTTMSNTHGYHLNYAFTIISSLAFTGNILFICILVAACRYLHTKIRDSSENSGRTTLLGTKMDTDASTRIMMMSELKQSIGQKRGEQRNSKHNWDENDGLNEQCPSGDNTVPQQLNAVCLDSKIDGALKSGQKHYGEKDGEKFGIGNEASSSTNNADCGDLSSPYTTLKHVKTGTDPSALEGKKFADGRQGTELNLPDGEPTYENVSRSKRQRKQNE